MFNSKLNSNISLIFSLIFIYLFTPNISFSEDKFLKKLNLPFTLFVSTDVIDNNFSNYMNWDQIRELVDNGVLVGSQTKSHPHLHRLSSKQILNEIQYSNKRFIKELGF